MRPAYLAPVVLAGVFLAACSSGSTTSSSTATTGSSDGSVVATGQLANPAGAPVGTVEFREVADGMRVSVTATGLTPGFHGIHLHTIGKCEADSADPSNPASRGNFNSSGGHLAGAGNEHPSHDGDLPALLVQSDGKSTLVAVTNRVTRAELVDADGTALIVHERTDNYANIPTRYATTGADAESKKAGDAGARVACAVITAS